MVISLDTFFRFATIALLFVWSMYWLITERDADREKPKVKTAYYHKNTLRKWLLRFMEAIVVIQLLGLPIFQIQNATIMLQLCGFLLVIVGMSVAITARRTLGTNWAHAFEYQVKQKQELVTSGIYASIRHPIYTGLTLAIIGGELVAQSYLVFIGLILIFGGYHQAKLEEKLLLTHFGEAYEKYMKRTKMFLPFLW